MPTRTVQRRGSVLAVMVVFAAAGFLMGQGLSRIPAVRDQLDAGKAELGMALMGMGLGSLLIMPVTGRLVDRFGSNRVVPAMVVVASLGWALIPLMPSVPVLLATLTVTGMATGAWDVAMNIQASHVEQHRDRSWMTYFHAGFSGGAVLGAGAGALLSYLGVGLVQLPVLALLAAVCGALAATRFVPEDVGEGGGEGNREGLTGDGEGATAGEEPPVRRGLTGLEILIGVVCLSAALAEGAANDWLALLLVDVHDAPQAFGALALTAFNLTMTVGRLVGGPVIDRIGRVQVVRLGGLLSAAGILIVVLVPSLAAALVGGLMWGLGVSTIFPAAMSAGGEVPGRGNRAITTVSTIAYGAFLFGAPTIGLIAEWVGLDRALFFVVAFLLVMTLLAPVMRSRRP